MKRGREETTEPALKGGTLHSLEDRKSWLISLTMQKDLQPSKEEIKVLWLLKPETKGKILFMGKPMETPRYSQTYSNEGKGYTFSGMTHTALPIPPLLQRYLDYANTLCREMLVKDYESRQFNMAFVNWYPDGKHHIRYHSDDEKQLFKSTKGESLVFSISLGQQRTFLVKTKDKESKEKTLSIQLANHTVVLMGGLCQTNYKHAVPLTKLKNVGPRINLTFRIFK